MLREMKKLRIYPAGSMLAIDVGGGSRWRTESQRSDYLHLAPVIGWKVYIERSPSWRFTIFCAGFPSRMRF